MIKTVFTLCVDNYSPAVTALTFPLMQAYAKKIGAEFHVIRERRFPTFAPVFEKLQIYYLGQRSDWNIYIDADCLVHPDFFDVTEVLPMDTVLHNATDFAPNRIVYDDYFRRDGRNIGCCNWFTVASRWCLDLWHPLDIPYEEALKRIHVTKKEADWGIQPEHLIDDYALSRNVARFGLKLTRLRDLLPKLGDNTPTWDYLWHAYGGFDEMLGNEGIRPEPDMSTEDKKALLLRQVLKRWNMD